MATLRYVWNQYASPLMLLLLLVAVVVGVAVGVGLARVRVRRGKAPLSRGTYFVGVLLWLWLVGMVFVTLLGSRGIWGSGEVNLQLFLAWEEAWYAGDRTAWLYIVLNLALFLPLGVLLPLLETRFQKVTWVLGTAAVLSLAVELLQLVLRRGSADIDDWFLNVLGLLGLVSAPLCFGAEKTGEESRGLFAPAGGLCPGVLRDRAGLSGPALWDASHVERGAGRNVRGGGAHRLPAAGRGGDGSGVLCRTLDGGQLR